MLFHSQEFLFYFLPLVLVIFYLFKATRLDAISLYFLITASLFFYAYWKVEYLLLLLSSILINYLLGGWLCKRPDKKAMISGVVFNLLLLGYFKYLTFSVNTFNYLTDSNFISPEVILPLAISFFTFQQIAYLVDAYQQKISNHNIRDYFLFVSFFPQLIAGPIVHHHEMLPQFKKESSRKEWGMNMAVGLTLLSMGLFKKAILADSVAPYSDEVFNMAESGETVTMLAAWSGLLAFSFQIYFDFSAYSDMALGIARMFGIKLPVNFYSPYKAKSISEFWSQWHMTLSRFLKEYLYIPLGGNRSGHLRTFLNLFITMFLGGLWHGASWTFVVWGVMHGVFLIIFHASKTLGLRVFDIFPKFFQNTLRCGLTMFAVMNTWVFFRADSFSSALALLQGMYGFNGLVLPEKYMLFNFFSLLPVTFHSVPGFFGLKQLMLLAALGGVIWFMPNTIQMIGKFDAALEGDLKPLKNQIWQPKLSYGIAMGFIFFIGVSLLWKVEEFVYFQF